MAKYLDYAGLQYLWTKIKGLVTALDVPKFEIAENNGGKVTLYTSLQEVDGKIYGATGVTGYTSIEFEKVATSGKAEDVSVTGHTGQTNVQDAIDDLYTKSTTAVHDITGDDWIEVLGTTGGTYALSHKGAKVGSTAAANGISGTDPSWEGNIVTAVNIDVNGHVSNVTTGKLPVKPVYATADQGYIMIGGATSDTTKESIYKFTDSIGTTGATDRVPTAKAVSDAIADAVKGLDSNVESADEFSILTEVGAHDGVLDEHIETKLIGGNKVSLVGVTGTTSTPGSITVNHDTVTVADDTAQSLSFGGTFAVYTHDDGYGHVDKKATLTLPASPVIAGTNVDGYIAIYDNTGAAVASSGVGITTNAPDSNSSDYTIPTSKAVNSAIENAIGELAGALIYKGAVNSNSDLPGSPEVGWTYVVATAGTYAGKACEVGDYLIWNGSSWDAVNGENQVSNTGNVLVNGSNVKIAEVDGTDITVKLPSLGVGLQQAAAGADATVDRPISLKPAATSEIGGGKVGATGSTATITRPTESSLASGESSHIAPHYVDIKEDNTFYVDIYGLTFAEIDAACSDN